MAFPRNVRQQTPFKDDQNALTELVIVTNTMHMHFTQWMNERTYHILYQANTPRLWSKTKKYVSYVCFLKLIVKFTSIFGFCRFKKSKAWHFLTFRSFSSKLEFVVIPCDLVEWRSCSSSCQVWRLDESKALEIQSPSLPSYSSARLLHVSII